MKNSKSAGSPWRRSEPAILPDKQVDNYRNRFALASANRAATTRGSHRVRRPRPAIPGSLRCTLWERTSVAIALRHTYHRSRQRRKTLRQRKSTPGFPVQVLSDSGAGHPGDPGRRRIDQSSPPRTRESGSPTPENPLTARVMVNRLWHYLLGAWDRCERRRVTSASTGQQSQPIPSCSTGWPCEDSSRSGWSDQVHMHRLIMSSLRTYQMSSAFRTKQAYAIRSGSNELCSLAVSTCDVSRRRRDSRLHARRQTAA